MQVLLFASISFIFLHGSLGADLKLGGSRKSLNTCCLAGQDWYRSKSTCDKFMFKSRFNSKDENICQTMSFVCCRYLYQKKQCTTGKLAAKDGKICPAKYQNNHFVKHCCDACSLGIYGAQSGIKCEFPNLKLDYLWHKTFQECCRDELGSIISKNVTNPVDVPPTNNLCEQFSGQLCGHICKPTVSSYKCECREGFKLSPDGKTCLLDNKCASTNPCEHKCEDTGTSIECSCHAGYQLRSDERTCEDLNECISTPSICGLKSTCANTIGSYSCVPSDCPTGHYFNLQYENCLDINECNTGYHLCNKITEECQNIKGSYKCIPKMPNKFPSPSFTTIRPLDAKCKPGFQFDERIKWCTDINECLLNPCTSAHESCINSQGSYTCGCKLGFTRNSITGRCEDINECQKKTHTCDPYHRCENSLGSFKCIRNTACGTGYTLNHRTGECEDDDECELALHQCSQLGTQFHCINTKGSFRCEKKTCPPNQILNSIGLCGSVNCTSGYKAFQTQCIDINECIEGPYPCQANENCINFQGHYECRPKMTCKRGFRLNDYGSRCEDIDECAENSSTCKSDQICVNRVGWFSCNCKPGFRSNTLGICEDINECQNYIGLSCGRAGICENTIGSFICRCQKGYKKSATGNSCIDVNECLEVNNACDHNCVNTLGSHKCYCRAGYRLQIDQKTCRDIDECEESRSKGKICIGICENVPGSYQCTCPAGYTLDSSRRRCKDINECSNIGACTNPNSVCVNLRGGYKCHPITCPPNYVSDPTHKNRCKKQLRCTVDDLDCLKLPLTYSYNYLPLASNLDLGSSGRADLFTMRGSTSSTKTIDFDLEVESAESPQRNVALANLNYFYLKKTAYNQVVLQLVKSLQGPQDIVLNLKVKFYEGGYYQGTAISQLNIFVSEYDF